MRRWLLVLLLVAAELLFAYADDVRADTPQQRVLVVAYEPLMPDGRTLAQAQGWLSARELTDSLVDALGRAGRDYWLMERRTINLWAPGAHQMSPANWPLFCGGAGRWYTSPICYYAGSLDVEAVLREVDRPVDEVWIVMPPYVPESREFYLLPNRPKLLVLNQERRLAEALESYGHMEEAQRGLLDMQGPVHRPPGSVRPYQYDGPGCAAWGCEQVGYLEWWLGMLDLGGAEAGASEAGRVRAAMPKGAGRI